MKISYNWLKEYFTAEVGLDEMNKILTQTGLEVEGCEPFERVKGNLAGLVVGEVLDTVKHPDADRLSLASVDVGNGDPSPIVCGAPNIAKGQKVIVALPGTTIYPVEGEPFKIKKSKIRGVESMGMICAEDEIGLGKSHDGIMVLDSSTKTGQAVSELFGSEADSVIEIGLTPNRTDAMSHYGVARDLVAALAREDRNASFYLPSVEAYAKDDDAQEVKVTVEDAVDCPRYAGVTLTNVVVKPSPQWIQDRLLAIGLQPLNNVVDITNYVPHETGQPLHAFDASKIKGGITVKRLGKDTVFTTLDGVERKLSDRDLMICDDDGGLCIAGVYGGLGSGVTSDTTTVFLESAFFNPVLLRNTAKRHGLNTDASFRFERGVDPDLTIYALKRAALLMKEFAGATISSDITDLYPNEFTPAKIEFSLANLTNLVGQEIKPNLVKRILESLEIKVVQEDGAVLLLEIPPYRHDVIREVDVIEEVLRIYGYNNISSPAKFRSSISYREKPDKELLRELMSDMLVSRGFTEIMSNSLTSDKDLGTLGDGKLDAKENVRLTNPLSIELDVLRQTLILDGLKAISYSSKRQRPDLRLFEVGKSYKSKNGNYEEATHFALFATGRKNPESWNSSDEGVSFFDLNGAVEAVFDRLGLGEALSSEVTRGQWFGEGVVYSSNGKEVASVGKVAKEVLAKWDIDADVYAAELNWEALVSLRAAVDIKYREIPKFPEVKRDLSMLVDSSVQFGDIESNARKVGGGLLLDVNLFDQYEGKNLPEGKKSYAVRFILQDVNKTLEDKQIEKVMAKITSALQSNVGAELR